MKKFIKITTRKDDAIVISWNDANMILQLSQNSITQAGNNEGTLTWSDGTTIPIINFNATIDSLA